MPYSIKNQPQKQRYYNNFHSIIDANDFESIVLDEYGKHEHLIPYCVKKVIKKQALSDIEWEDYYEWLSIQIEKRKGK